MKGRFLMKAKTRSKQSEKKVRGNVPSGKEIVVSDKDRTTIRLLAKRACKRHKTIEGALAWLMECIQRSPALREAILEEAIRNAAREAIYVVRHQDKREVKQNACSRSPEAFARMGASMMGLLPLWLVPKSPTAAAKRIGEPAALAAPSMKGK